MDKALVLRLAGKRCSTSSDCVKLSAALSLAVGQLLGAGCKLCGAGSVSDPCLDLSLILARRALKYKNKFYVWMF